MEPEPGRCFPFDWSPFLSGSVASHNTHTKNIVRDTIKHSVAQNLFHILSVCLSGTISHNTLPNKLEETPTPQKKTRKTLNGSRKSDEKKEHLASDRRSRTEEILG